MQNKKLFAVLAGGVLFALSGVTFSDNGGGTNVRIAEDGNHNAAPSVRVAEDGNHNAAPSVRMA